MVQRHTSEAPSIRQDTNLFELGNLGARRGKHDGVERLFEIGRHFAFDAHDELQSLLGRRQQHLENGVRLGEQLVANARRRLGARHFVLFLRNEV